MDSNPFSHNFVDLLRSQQETVFSFEDCVEKTPTERRERRIWTPVDDEVLISSWLNTSKDPVVGNEQKCGTFWKRIAAYFAASPKIAGSEHREAAHCKQRWQKINDLVNKFCGAFEAASRERTSGQNENDVLKLAHEIFFNNHKKKFTLDHAWKELRNDQKWCEISKSKTNGSSKRRKLDEGAQSSTSHASEANTGDAERPPGVKAAKRNGKKTKPEGQAVTEFASMWSIKQEDMARKERLSKMKLLDSLIAKEELAEYEEALKKKLVTDLLSN
ncbi:hypothetical protein N665_5662s0001 [Sinapis alba]|nr:hypothetical protein N665_5662s0001 [Sinapis alba]